MLIRWFSLLIALISLLSTSAGSASDLRWSSPPYDIDPLTAYDDWAPRLAIGADGTAWVVWMAVDPLEGDEEVMFSRWSGLAWDTPRKINPGNQTADRFPQIATARDGTVWTLWTVFSPGTGDYAGVCSRWSGTNWTWPDTVWVGGGRHDHYLITPVGAQEAWVTRSGPNGASWDIKIYHLVGGSVGSVFDYGSSDSDEVYPSVAVDLDGTPWAVWEQAPLISPSQARLQFARYDGASWDLPSTIDSPIGITYSYIHAGPDDTKWIICEGSDPVNGYRGEAIFGLKWDGSKWDGPVRISDPIVSNDSTQVSLSISRNPLANARAIWIRRNLFSTTRYDPLTSGWTGTEWTRPELAGELADSAYIMHPDVVATSDGAICVAYMRQALPDPTWHVYSTHRMQIPTGVTFIQFDVRSIAEGAEITWQVPLHSRGVSSLRVIRAAGVFGPEATSPPSESNTIFQTAGDSTTTGSTQDVLTQLAGPDFSYWMEVRLNDGDVIWRGPRSLRLVRAQTSQLLNASPNPTSGTVRIHGWVARVTVPIVRIFDVGGRLIRTLRLPPPKITGEFSIQWDGLTEDGRSTASGIYLARLGFSDPTVSTSLRIALIR
jgi:flagellar hook capping protein FlgD